MKKWNTPDLKELNINETASGRDLWGQEKDAHGLLSWVIGDDAKKPVTPPTDNPSAN